MHEQTNFLMSTVRFCRQLQADERSPATIENYLRHIRAFASWVGETPITKELATQWKEHLVSSGYRPGTVNTMLVSLSRFFDFWGWHDCQVKPLRLPAFLSCIYSPVVVE